MQNKAQPVINGQPKVSITSLMAAMAADLVGSIGRKCLLVLDAYFAVGPVFLIVKNVVDSDGLRLVHIVTRAKSNVVGYADPPAKTGGRGRPRIYGDKLGLMTLFDVRASAFEQTAIEIYGCCRTVSFLCLDLVWKPFELSPNDLENVRRLAADSHLYGSFRGGCQDRHTAGVLP